MTESRWRETIGHGFGTGKHKGTTKTWEVRRDDNGKVGGTQTEHWDGRLDANVHMEPVHASMHLGPAKED